MRIPEHTIEDIRSSANIVDIISSYVQLRKRGRNFIGLCPFHQEKTPSFTVSEEKQIFHCFGCHAGGNVYKFLMEYKSISFIEAVQEIAESVGITLDVQEEQVTSGESELEKYYDLNVFAAKYFSDNLLKNENGEIARDYLLQRNIKPQTQKIFGLGFAQNGWDNFVNYLKQNQVDLDDAKLLGLIDSKDGGKYYDKFRGRIIFPIFSPNGRVIAFGGRVFQGEDNVAKYLNSPESSIYLKRKSLYGLFHSKDEIRKLNKAILVEGYMDIIALYQHGIKNAVASSGTSLTEEQVRLLSRYTTNIVVIFDADEAGTKAAMRSIEILLKQDFDVNVLSLPKGEDPDSFVNKFGKEQFEENIQKAQNFLEFQTSQFESAGMFDNPTKEAEAIRELVKTAAFVDDELKRGLLIRSISRKFNLREKLLESELNKYLQINKKAIQPKPFSNVKDGKPKSQISSEEDKRLISVEKEVIQLLFEGNEEIIGNIFDTILPEDFTNKSLGKIAKVVHDEYLKGQYEPAALIEKIEDDKLKNYILTITLGEYQISSTWDKRSSSGKVAKDPIQYTLDTIRKYQIIKIDEQIKANEIKIENLGNDPEVLQLMKTNDELRKEKKELNGV
ncbi:MAG: DNA primase [Ignavibacteriae bacterium]|nr:DNA primase [Ignavibacteriota bacterium]MCB9258921.1 DNA primase [Ignavibacteriales bacterium]